MLKEYQKKLGVQSNWQRSLDVLKFSVDNMSTKTGIMVGLGETDERGFLNYGRYIISALKYLILANIYSQQIKIYLFSDLLTPQYLKNMKLLAII